MSDDDHDVYLMTPYARIQFNQDKKKFFSLPVYNLIALCAQNVRTFNNKKIKKHNTFARFPFNVVHRDTICFSSLFCALYCLLSVCLILLLLLLLLLFFLLAFCSGILSLLINDKWIGWCLGEDAKCGKILPRPIFFLLVNIFKQPITAERPPLTFF